MEAAFWAKTEPEPNTGCTIWIGSRDPHGYGQLHNPETKRPERAHRIGFEIETGVTLRSDYGLHRCDNRWCVNGRHIFRGNAKLNIEDALTKGTAAVGARVGTAKLTDGQVLLIRAAYAAGETQRPLAARFGVTQGTIQKITSRRTWRYQVQPS